MNLACLLGALLVLWLAIFLVAWIARRILLAIEAAIGAGKRLGWITALRRNLRFLFVTVGLVASLGVGAYGGVLWYRGEDLRVYATARLAEVPQRFWWDLARGFASFLGLALVAWLLLRIVRRVLRAAATRAKRWEGIKANDESVERFFSGLVTLITRATWLAVFGIGAGWIGLSTDVSATIFLALRVYLILAIGVLVWRSIDAMIESLDALSR